MILAQVEHQRDEIQLQKFIHDSNMKFCWIRIEFSRGAAGSVSFVEHVSAWHIPSIKKNMT